MPAISRPIHTALCTARAQILEDGRIDAAEVDRLIAIGDDAAGDDRAGRDVVAALVADHADAFSANEALSRARAFVEGDHHSPPSRPPVGDLYSVTNGPDGRYTSRQQRLVLGGTGAARLDIGTPSYSRGFLQMNQNVLGRVHGSGAPSSTVLSASDRAALNRTPPGQRLDRMAEAAGRAPLSPPFSEVAKLFSDPDQPDWGGVCYSWAWTALSARLSALVDVPGPEGQRGLWLGGQWMSRADLGNWLMALASPTAQGEGEVIWYAPDVEDAIKASLSTLAAGGPGFRADLGPAVAEGEIWFQPITGADVRVSRLPAAAEAAVIERARIDEQLAYGMKRKGVDGVAVRLVEVEAEYGDEADDAHEGHARSDRIAWRGYAVLDAEGAALRILPANDPRLAGIVGLPTRETDPAPNSLFRPDHEVIDDLFHGRADPGFEQRHLGAHLRFFIEQVLGRGVPGTLRAAFEREVALRPPGPIDAGAAEALAERFPGVERAYTPDQWTAAFGSRGLDRGRFAGNG